MLKRLMNLSGQKFGRWTAKFRAPDAACGRSAWECVCDCGVSRAVIANNLVRGLSVSCGCAQRQSVSALKTHGESRTKGSEYVVWKNMFTRCNNPQARGYENYGGRGIKVCAEWTGPQGYAHFLADLGRRPTPRHTLEREDNDKGYSKDNCRWATRQDQAMNKRSNITVTLRGQRMVYQHACEAVGWNPRTVRVYATRHKVSLQKALDHYAQRDRLLKGV